MVRDAQESTELACQGKTCISHDEAAPMTGSPLFSRRRVMALGTAGVASLLLLGRGVLGGPSPPTQSEGLTQGPPSPTPTPTPKPFKLGQRLALEINELLHDTVTEGMPKLAKTEMEKAYQDLVIRPFNRQVARLVPPPDPTVLTEAREELNATKLQLGQIARDAGREIAASGARGIINVLRQLPELSLRLDQPTFQPPFDPEFSFIVERPSLSTSQSPTEIFHNFLNNRHPLVDADKFMVQWHAFTMNAVSSVDKLRLTVDVAATNFLERDFQLKLGEWKFNSGQWQSHLGVEWTHAQNGIFNTLRAGLSGHYYFDRALKIGPWEVLVVDEFSWTIP